MVEKPRQRVERRAGQRARARLVGVADAGQLGREIGEDDVGRSAERRAHGVEGGCRSPTSPTTVTTCASPSGGVVDQVDADDAAVRSDALGGDLQPGAGPGAEVDDHVARAQEAVAIVELDSL